MTTGWLLLLAYIGLLVWALRKPGWRFDGPWWFHLRAFLPNWKFYHAPGWMPRLVVRHRSAAGSKTSEWQTLYPRQHRQLAHLWHNPDVNLALAWQNLVDHLANDINHLTETDRIEDQPIYTLVERLAAHGVVSLGASEQHQFQFELRLVHATQLQTEVALTSPWTDLSKAISVQRTAHP